MRIPAIDVSMFTKNLGEPSETGGCRVQVRLMRQEKRITLLKHLSVGVLELGTCLNFPK